MKVVYVAGKYSSDSPDEVFENIYLARYYAKQLWLKGYAVICPHLNSFFMDGTVLYLDFLKGDLEIIRRCDMVFLLPNWRESRGAVMEHEYARSLGIEIVDDLEVL